MASSMFGIRAIVTSISAVLVMNIVHPLLGARKTVLLGALMTSLAAILPSLKDDLTSIVSLQGVFLGLAVSMLIAPGEVLIGSYFRKRLSTALALVKCGVSLGNVIIPPLTSYLIEEYGLQGAFLLIGGVCIHSFPATLLLEPTSNYTKRKRHLKCTTRKQKFSKHSLDDHSSIPTKEILSSNHENASENRADGSVIINNLEKHQNTVAPVIIPKTLTSEFAAANHNSSITHSPGSEDQIQTNIAYSSSNATPMKPKILDSKQEMISSCRGFGKSFELVSNLPPDLRSGDLVTQSHSSPHKIAVELGEPVSVTSSSESCVEEWNLLADKQDYQEDQDDQRSKSSVLEYSSQPTLEAKTVVSVDQSESSAFVAYEFPDYQRPRTFSRPLSVTYTSVPIWSMSQNGTKSNSEVSKDLVIHPTKPKVQPSAAPSCIPTCFKKILFLADFSLFRSHLFKLLLLYFSLSLCINLSLDFLPAAAAEKGVDQSQAALMISIISGLDFACRMLSGIIADLKIVRVSTMIVFSYVIIGIMLQFVRFMTSFNLFLVLVVIEGLLGGVCYTLENILIIDFLKLENLGKTKGFAMLCSQASRAVLVILLGLLRDVTGSYNLVYHVLGALLFMAAGILCCEGIVRRMDMNRKVESDIMTVTMEEERQTLNVER